MKNLPKKKREEKKLTQETTGACLGLKRVTIAQYEAKKRFPRKDILPKYAKLLGITTDEYVKWYNSR